VEIADFTKSHIDELVALRHELHMYPDLPEEEENAAKIIQRYLNNLSTDKIISGIGGCGIVCVIEGENDGPAVMLRSELDALPIEEKNDFVYKSIFSGKSHKCGHDGHSAILAGVARYFSENRPKSGKVILLFQPAEESGTGAANMLADPKFDQISYDYAFALHNLTGYPLGHVIIKSGSFNSASRGLVLNLSGNGAHPADAGLAQDPGGILSEIIHELYPLHKGFETDGEFLKINITYFSAGDPSMHKSPGAGELHAVLRTATDKGMSLLIDQITSLIEEKSLKTGIEVDIAWAGIFDATNNHPEATELIRVAARRVGTQIVELESPIGPSDDFFRFMNPVKGALYGIGAGVDVPWLHMDLYDFPDELIPNGIELSIEIVNQILK